MKKKKKNNSAQEYTKQAYFPAIAEAIAYVGHGSVDPHILQKIANPIIAGGKLPEN